jgi:hypothetical protein
MTNPFAATMASAQCDDMVAGLVWLGGGIAVSALSYALAAPGGSYFIALGAVGYGIRLFIRAVSLP